MAEYITLWRNYETWHTCGINFRLGPNSETPPGGRYVEFQYGRHIAHTFAYNFETEADRNVISFSGSRNPAKSSV